MSVESIAIHDNRCGRPRLSDGRGCQQRTGGGPCRIHEELPGPAHDAVAIANIVRAAATAARPGSDTQKAARHLLKVLSAAGSLETARKAVQASPTASNREAMIRLLDAAEIRASKAAIENIAWDVEDIWGRFRLATVLSGEVPDSDYELEARAILKASMQQMASHFAGQLAEARQQAADARDASAKAADRFIDQARRVEERAEAALDGLIMQHLDLQMDPNGYYVYLLWGTDEDRPLYVGQSTNIFGRLGSHMNDPAKRFRIRRVMVIKCKTERQMDSTELRLIRKYRPELNTAGVPRDQPV